MSADSGFGPEDGRMTPKCTYPLRLGHRLLFCRLRRAREVEFNHKLVKSRLAHFRVSITIYRNLFEGAKRRRGRNSKYQILHSFVKSCRYAVIAAVKIAHESDAHGVPTVVSAGE